MILTLNLKAEYFDAIARGEKTEEFRLVKAYWLKRLLPAGADAPVVFDHIVLCRGYPRRNDSKRRMVRPWRGWTVRTISHPHFGPGEVAVFALRVN